MITLRTALLMSSAIVAAAVATPAIAQNTSVAGAPVAQANNGQTTNEDVIVTAQKREQTLIDVPQSISVVSQATLETQQANDFQDYLKLVPGLQLDQSTPGEGRLILRGLNTGGVASTVAVYVDETPFGSSTALANGAVLAGDFNTFDVARVEVLRGPQGTLYGASSLGGLLKFVTNAPDPSKIDARVRGSVETTKGGDISYAGDAVVNIPLASTLAFRASGFYRHDGGWIDSIGTTGTDAFGNAFTTRQRANINGARVYGGRAALLFEPSTDFSIRLTASLQNIHADAPSTVDSDPNTLRTLYGRPTQSEFSPSFSNVNYRVYNGLISYDFGFAKLTSSTSYSTQNQAFHTDATFNLSGLLTAALKAPANELYLAQQTRDRRFTQEVRLSSDKSDLFDWLIGGYYTDEKGKLFQEYVDVMPGTNTPIAFPFTLAQVSLDSKYREYAGFADATVHLGRMFDIDVGGRYSHNDQRAGQSAAGVLAGNVPINSNIRSSDNVFTYSVAPKVKFGDHASVYVRVAKGYRPGGPNVIAPAAPAGTPTSFNPDTVTNYEAGVKAETADRTLGVELAVYRIDWNNIQLFSVVNGFGVNVNGSRARSQGLEFTATARPVPGVVISANGAYTDAKLRNDAPALVGGLKGERLPFTPEYAASINSDYDWNLSATTKAFAGASLRFLSKQSANFDAAYRAANGRQREVPSYDVVDLRAGLDFGRFGVEAFVRNVTDADGKTSVNPLTANGLPLLPNGAIATGEIRPRTFGLSVTAGL